MSRTLHLATIGAPFGVRGHFRVKTFTENPENILSYAPLTDDKGHVFDLKLIRVEDIRTIIVSSPSVPDRTAAEKIRGIKIYGEVKDEDQKDDSLFFIHNLVGMHVMDTEGTPVGTIFDVENYGASDILIIKTDSGYLQIAFIEESVPTINQETKTVTVVKEHLL